MSYLLSSVARRAENLPTHKGFDNLTGLLAGEMASGDGQSQLPSMLLGTYGKDPMCLVDGRGIVLPSSQPDLQQRPWIPDERDAFISWLRGEFAAANAIIDAMCHHLQMIGKPGEYDFVLTCIQQRRYNWTVVLHMQQYFSVAEVMFALQQVVWQKKQPHPSEQSHMQSQQFYSPPDVDGSHPQKEMLNGIHDARDLRGDTIIPRYLPMPQTTGNERQPVVSDSLDTSGRSDMSTERAGSFQSVESIPEVAVIAEGAHIDIHEDLKNSASSTRICEDAEPGGADADQTSIEKCANGDVKDACVLEERQPPLSTRTLVHEDEERREGMYMPSRCFTCLEPLDGKTINVAEGLELFENVLDMNEASKLAILISDLPGFGRRGRAFPSTKKGSNGKSFQTIQFGGLYPELHNDAEPMPAFLQGVVERLVSHRIIAPNRVPDSCSIHILEEGDYLPPHFDHSHIERPFCYLTLSSESTLVLGQLLTMDAPGDFKGAFHLTLPVGSVLVLQGNSADVARHALSSSPLKRISITLGKLIANKAPRIPPQLASLPHVVGAPSVSSQSPWSPGYNNRLPSHSSKGPNFSNPKLHMLPTSGVLPVPNNVRSSSVQVMQNLGNTSVANMQPLFPTAPGQAGAYPPMAVLPQTPWPTMPRPPGPPSRAPSAGTGVFFPSGSVSSGPGRPVATTPQRRQGSMMGSSSQPMPILQKTFSLPANFSSPVPSPSPTKSGKSNQQLTGGDRDTPILPMHSRSYSGTSAQELSGLGRVTGKDLTDLSSPTSTTNGVRNTKEAKQTPSSRPKGGFIKSDVNGEGEARSSGTANS